jgi:hypothetical protein
VTDSASALQYRQQYRETGLRRLAVTGAIRKNKATSKPMLATAAMTSSNQGQGNVSKADEPTQIAASKPANNSSVSPMAFHRTDLKAGDRTSFAARNAEEIIGGSSQCKF